MLKFRSIRAALLSIILSLVIIGMLTISSLGYFYSKSIINDEITEKMEYQIDFVTESIEKRLLKHDQLAITLAQIVGATISVGNEESYMAMIEKVLTTNDDTYGAGVWFEAYGFQEEQKYFGPYAYKDNANISLTMDYSNEEYNYLEYDWYNNAKNTTDISAWSTPYYDEISDITMITTSVPFYNGNNNFAGVVTADIDLNSIQTLINETKVGENGWAFLLNDDGTYISNRDSEKIMTQNILNDPNESLAGIGQSILETGDGYETYLEAGEKYRLYYSQIPKTDWIIGLTVSEKELYSSLDSLLIGMVTIFILSLIVVSIGIILYTNGLSNNMARLKGTAESLANGDFTVISKIDSMDEIGILSTRFNTMIENIKGLLSDVIQVSNQVTNAATNLASTSEQVSASSDEIAKTIEEVARGAGEQASDAEQGAIIASSLDTKFEQLRDNSVLMSDNINEASDANKSGFVAVEDLIEKTNLNNEGIIRIEKAIGTLSVKSNNIGEILATISSIAEQTNLLSLNASIEAARAGEAGRGFAVVADEIRKLAVESEDATDTIRTIVEELQSESNNTVNIMDEVKLIIQEQTGAVTDVNVVFNRINKSIGMITSQIENVNNSVDTISVDKDNIVHSIENIAAVSEEAAAASQEVTASMEQQTMAIEEVAKNAEGLNEIALNLNEQINKFKI